MKKAKMRKAYCLMFLVFSLICVNTTVFAYGTSYKFTVVKGEGVEKSDVVYKNDAERNAYQTIEDVMWNPPDPYLFGSRVRTSGGTSLTDYKTYYKVVKSDQRPYLSGTPAYKGLGCKLHAQVDSYSRSGVITVSGVWTP